MDQETLRDEIRTLLDVLRISVFKIILLNLDAAQSAIWQASGAAEIQNMVDAALDGWLTAGRFNKQFETALAKFIELNLLLLIQALLLTW